MSDEISLQNPPAPEAGGQHPRSGGGTAAPVMAAVAVLAAAAVVLWSTLRSWPVGPPIAQLLPFGGLLLVIGLLAVRTRLMLHELRRLSEAIGAQLVALRAHDDSRRGEQLDALGSLQASLQDTRRETLNTLEASFRDARQETLRLLEASLEEVRGSLRALRERSDAVVGVGREVEQLRRDVLALRAESAALRGDAETIKQGLPPPGTPPADARLLADATSGVRGDVAALEHRLRESVARIRHDIEDDKMLLVDLLGGHKSTPGPNTGNERDGFLGR